MSCEIEGKFMPLRVKARTVYGRDVFYPLNDVAQTFADLMQRKTFDREALTRINRLSLVLIKIEYDEVKL